MQEELSPIYTITNKEGFLVHVGQLSEPSRKAFYEEKYSGHLTVIVQDGTYNQFKALQLALMQKRGSTFRKVLGYNPMFDEPVKKKAESNIKVKRVPTTPSKHQDGRVNGFVEFIPNKYGFREPVVIAE